MPTMAVGEARCVPHLMAGPVPARFLVSGALISSTLPSAPKNRPLPLCETREGLRRPSLLKIAVGRGAE
jgi:hypothetical protein